MKTFTVEEANRTLPLVRRIVEDITERYERWRELVHASELLAAEAMPGAVDPRLALLERDIQERALEISRFVDELESLGVHFKGFDGGLVDYPAVMDDRPIYLCWRLGEPAVEHWHDRNAGFAGRRPLAAAR
jgi:hypothetical protein